MDPAPARRSAAVRLHVARLVSAVAVSVLALAGCAAGTTPAPSPSGPPSTSVLLPAATGAPGTPGTSMAGSPAALPSSPPSAGPIAITDDEGTSIALVAPPKRIVSLTPATTEILFAIGHGDLVVGKSEDPTPFPPAAASVPIVTTMGTVNVEKIVGLEPDLVVAGGLGFTSSEAIKKLRDLGTPVAVLYAPDVAGVLTDVRLTATLAGDAASGNAIAASMQADLDAVTAAASAGTGPRPRVFYEIDATKEIYGPADRSFLAEMIRRAGGDPITTGSPDAYSIPLERLISADPQIIILGDAAYGTTVEQVRARSGWAVMTAVKTGAIRPIDDVVVTRPGPRLTDGLRALATAINPDVVLPSPAASPAASAAP